LITGTSSLFTETFTDTLTEHWLVIQDAWQATYKLVHAVYAGCVLVKL